MRRQLTLLFLVLLPLLFGAVVQGYSQCSTNGAGISALQVANVTDTGVTFRWSTVSTAQNSEYAVTTDSSYTGYTGNPDFVYYLNYTADTFATQGSLQPNTKYWIFVQKTNCSGLDSISFTTLPLSCTNGDIDNLTLTALSGTTVNFKWNTTQQGDTYRWGLTDSLQLPDTLRSTKDTFATYGGLAPGTKYYLFVTDSSVGCGSRFDTLSFIARDSVVNPCPPGALPPVPTIRSSTGSFTVCANSALLLTSSSVTGNIWYFNGTLLDSTAASVAVTQGGNYSVVVTNAAGCSDTSMVQVVTLDPGPPTPVLTASGSTTICIGSSVTLSSSSGTGNQWYEGNEPLPGITGSEYLVNQAGQYWVQVTDGYGCWANSARITVKVNTDTAGESVVPTVTPTGPLALCSDTAVLLVSSPAVNFQWFWDGAAIPGENGDTLTVTLTGNYSVATGTTGCGTVGAMSSPVKITYLDQLVPVITMANGVLVSSAAKGNQWYLNDSIIPGATHQQFTPQGPGSYTLRVQNGLQSVDTSTFEIGAGGCWSQYSLPYLISDSIYIVPELLVYPNPVADVLTMVNKQAGPVTVRIFNLMGQQVLALAGVTGTVQVDVARWSKGAYFIQVIDERTRQQEKMVVLRM
ncbi:MAG TPA: T9SS type A sorting domain-containing protein [Puia sp.]|jgi:hypothetical protein|nr:T9SS type A sorting domain-containing protein [Puia sp.]